MKYDFVKQDHYQLITEGEAKFIFDQSEKHLKDQIDTSQQIATKTTTLLTVVSSLLIGLIGFVITRWSKSGFDTLTVTTICGIIYMYTIAYILLKNIQPSIYRSIGLHPRDLFDEQLFNDKNSHYRLKALYINEIIECQKKIDFNNKTNNTRWKRFNLALRLTSYSPAVFILFYGIIRLLALLFLYPCSHAYCL